jgi:hypothetical protein
MDEALIVEQREFLERHHHNAIMTTVAPAGRPHAAPVLCALVDRAEAAG